MKNSLLFFGVTALVALLFLSGCATTSQEVKGPKTMENVDLAKYSGTWYEISRYPNRFQRGCKCSTATYEVIGPESVRVTNVCYREDGTREEITGIAHPVNTGNSKLEVRFQTFISRVAPNLVKGDYWILHVDDDYQHAVVGDPNREFLWILSREPSISTEKYLELTGIAEKRGYDPARLEESICSAFSEATTGTD